MPYLEENLLFYSNFMSSNTLKDDSELVQLKSFSVPLSLKNKCDVSISALNAGFDFTQYMRDMCSAGELSPKGGKQGNTSSEDKLGRKEVRKWFDLVNRKH